MTAQRLALNSLLFDPVAVWQLQHRPFLEDGDPSRDLQDDVASSVYPALSFPFRSQEYILQRGRATLAGVLLAQAETTNQYYHWAVDHQEPHFGLRPHGAALARAFEATYNQVVAKRYKRDHRASAASRRAGKYSRRALVVACLLYIGQTMGADTKVSAPIAIVPLWARRPVSSLPLEGR